MRKVNQVKFGVGLGVGKLEREEGAKPRILERSSD
jgi:hypothetical protein